jgi:hypothetical protein
MATENKIEDPDGKTYRKNRAERNEAMKASFAKAMPQTQQQSIRSGAEIDAEIAALQQRVSALETSDTAQNQRLTALEAGETAPPVEPPPETGGGGGTTPPTGKRYPSKDDPICGVPAGTSLASGGAGTTISQAGAKISGKKFTGRVTISAENVEIFNCEIETGDWWGINVLARNANIHHCTIKSSATNGNSGINTSTGTKVAYCRFRGWENAFNISGNDVVIEWNDACELKGNNDSHYDVLQADGGLSNLLIQNNRFDCQFSHTSAVMLDNYFGKIEKVTVKNNWLGGGGMPCYLDARFKGAANAIDIKYLDNDLKKGSWGYFFWESPGTGCERRGNKDHVTGENVDNR